MLSSLMLVGGNWFINFLKTVTHVIDQGIYFLVQAAYQVFYFIANATILNADIVENFTLRVYTLIGIVMVFVLAFNLLNYIVDPDKITDKKVGASSFVKDVILAIAIISLSPMLFTKLYSLQSAILTSGVIENLILGGATGADVMSEDEWNNNQGKYKSYAEYMIANGGNSMVASVYVAFLYPADGTFTALDCVPNDPAKNGKYNDYCLAYKAAQEGGSLKVFDPYITNDDYNFTPLLTTVAGVVLLFFMLSFCINLAKRVGKMAILQLIAPVPVTLELLPNKKGLRDNWLKTLGKVYIEVFFYMAVMFLVMLLISLVPGTIQTLLGNAGIDTSGVGSALYTTVTAGPVKLFATVLLIYGLLMFGKEAPQMLFDLLGIKSTGVIKEAFQRGVKMAGATTAGLGAATTGFAHGATNMGRNIYEAIKNKKGAGAVAGAVFGGLGSMAGRTAGGFARGMYLNRSGGFKNIRATTTRAVNETETAGQQHVADMKRTWEDAKNYANTVKTATGVKNTAKAIFKPAGDAVANSAAARWANLSPYQQKKNQDEVLQQYKKLYADTIENLWKSDTQYSTAAADASRYKAYIKANGDQVDRTTGKLYSVLQKEAEAMRDARRLQVIQDKKLQFMEAAGKLNNFIDVHQGIKGITDTHLDLNAIANINATNAASILDNVSGTITGKDIKGTVVGDGFATELDKLKNDTAYQTERVQEKLRADAKEAARKATEQKSNNDKK